RSGPRSRRGRWPHATGRTPRGAGCAWWSEDGSNSVLREVVGRCVPPGLEPADLHQHVVEERRRPETEHLRRHPTLAEGLVEQYQIPDGVLGGADATGGLHPHHDTGGVAEVTDRF